ncbi:MAG: cytochrome c oxidase subunit II [Solirubrobacterales bacterium]|nr:cytochrome c oxidase subunit II [Solirubrobacterales bacterium]
MPRALGAVPTRPRRRGGPRRPAAFAVALCLSVGYSLLLAPVASANFIGPKAGGSPNANQISSLYHIILYIAAFVFVVVEGTLLYSVVKFRAKRVRHAAQIHGNTRLEVGWTVAAALILVAITVVTFVKLPSIITPPNSSAAISYQSASVNEPTPPNGKQLTICVTGRQFIWMYSYGAACDKHRWDAKLPYSYQQMVVPVHTTVVLVIQSIDVIHSWWVPALGGKVDAVPGYTTYTWFKALHTGLFHGQCAQLCGRQHAFMTAQVKVVAPGQYAAWLKQQGVAINAANDQVGTLRQMLTREGQL